MFKSIFSFFSIALIITTLISCQKDEISSSLKSGELSSAQSQSKTGSGTKSLSLSYGDTLFYLHPGGSNIIFPVNTLAGGGEYIGFPRGIELDSLTGAIDISRSETGLRYKIMYIIHGSSDTISTKITLSGINFYDGIYNLSKGDSIAPSIYNASGIPFVPGQFGIGKNCVFDDGNDCNKQGCNVSLVDGRINLAKSLRDGAVLRKNDSQKEFTYYYRMDDASDKALNHLKVKIYYYNSAADIPQYLWDIVLHDHAGTILPGVKPLYGSMRGAATARPRPPCLIIVMN